VSTSDKTAESGCCHCCPTATTASPSPWPSTGTAAASSLNELWAGRTIFGSEFRGLVVKVILSSVLVAARWTW